MDSSHSHLKTPAKIALTAMFSLFVAGVFYYKDRALFADAAFRIYNMLTLSEIQIYCHRYGSFIVQVLPFIAFKLNLSFKTILFVYSISYNLFYFSVAAGIIYGFRNYSLGILMALYYFLFFSESYIWVNELFQGMAWMFLMFATIIYLGKKKIKIAFVLIPFAMLALLTIFTHFVIIIPTVFLWVYFILDRENWPFSTRDTLYLSVMLAAIVAFKSIDNTANSYDGHRLYAITHVSFRDIFDGFSVPVVSLFFNKCVSNYWVAVIVFFVSVASLVKQQRALAIWTILSVAGYIAIMGVTYADQDSNVQWFHIESEWTSIAIPAAAGFVFAFLPARRVQTATIFLSILFLIRLIYICVYTSLFTERTNLDEQILVHMRKRGISKLAIINDEHIMAVNKLFWGLPFESLMMSALDGDHRRLTFCLVNPDDKKELEQIESNTGFFGGSLLPATLLDKSTLFPVDTTRYQIMSYADFLK